MLKATRYFVQIRLRLFNIAAPINSSSLVIFVATFRGVCLYLSTVGDKCAKDNFLRGDLLKV